jgi:hypothetical protein
VAWIGELDIFMAFDFLPAAIANLELINGRRIGELS